MTTQTATPALSAEVRASISDCLACYSACTEAVTYCLEQGGAHADSAHIRLLLDCAAMCRTAADFMLRNSDCQSNVCTLAAEVAAACARSCAGLKDDPRMKAVADACLRCASSCKQTTTDPAPRADYGGYDKTVADTYPASDPPSTSGARA